VRFGYRLLATLFLASGALVPVSAQDAAPLPDSLLLRLNASQRAQVTRAELQASLQEIETILSSSGYSSTLKDQKRLEADRIRQRLADGDIRPGDVVVLEVAGHPGLTGQFPVTTDRTIIVPDAGEIRIGPVLRSELEPFFKTEVRKYVREPVVRAFALIRISIFGGVQKQGFFVVPAQVPLTDVIMGTAGGPASNHKLEDSQIKRGDRVVLDKDGFNAALREARSLDELSLQAGDRIEVGQKRSGRLPILAAISTVASLSYLLIRIF
jgi:hypothetical protein